MRDSLHRYKLVLSWLIALAWTGLVCILMLLPGKNSVAADTSHFFGGTNLTDSIGHVLMYGILVGLWQIALAQQMPAVRALWWAAAFAVALGIMTEFGQEFVPNRGSSVFDVMADVLGVAVAAAVLSTKRHYLR